MEIFLSNDDNKSHSILYPRFTPKKSDDIENDMIYIDGNIYSSLTTYFILNSFNTSVKNLMVRDLKRSIYDNFTDYRKKKIVKNFDNYYSLSSDYNNSAKQIYEENFIIDHLSDMINENIQIEINKSLLDELDKFFIGPEKKITKEGAHNHSLLLLYDESGISDGNIIFSMYDVNKNNSNKVKDRLIFYRNKAIENIRNFLSEDLLYDNYIIYRAITYLLYHPISNHDNLMKYITTLDSKKLREFAYMDVKKFKINVQQKSYVYNKTVSLILILLNKNIRLLSQIVPKYFDNNIFNEMFYSYLDKSEIDKFNVVSESEFDINDIIDIEKKLLEINRTNIQDYGYHNLSFNEKEYFMLEDISIINIYRILFVKTICPRLFISEDIGDDYNKFTLQIIRNVYPRLNVYKKTEVHKNSLDLLLHSFIKNNRDNILSELKKDKNFEYEQKDLDTEYRKIHSILLQKYSNKIIENNDQHINSFDKTVKVNKDGKEIHYSIYNVYKKCINELAEVNFGSYTSYDIDNLQKDEFFSNYIDIELYKKNKDKDLINIQNIYLLQEKIDKIINQYYNSDSYNIDFKNSRKINFYTSKTKNKLFIFGNLLNLHRNILLNISKRIKVYGTVKFNYKHIRDDLYLQIVKFEFDEFLNHKSYIYDLFYNKNESYDLSFTRQVRLSKRPKNIKKTGLFPVLHLNEYRTNSTIKNIDNFVKSKLFEYNDDINKGLNITFHISIKQSIASALLINITSKFMNFIYNDFKNILLKSPDKYFKNYMKCLKSTGNSYIYINDDIGYKIKDDVFYDFKSKFLHNILKFYRKSLNDIRKDVCNIVLYTDRSMELFFCKRFLNSILKINDDNIPIDDYQRQIKKIYRMFDKEQFKYCFYETFKIVNNIKKLYLTIYNFIHNIYDKKYYDDDDTASINKLVNYSMYDIINILLFGHPNAVLLGNDNIEISKKDLTVIKENYIDFVKNYVDDEYKSTNEELKNKLKEVIKTDNHWVVLKNYTELYKKFYKENIDIIYSQNLFRIDDVKLYAGENFNEETYSDYMYIGDLYQNYGEYFDFINPACIINYYLVANIDRLGNDHSLYTIYKDMELNRNRDLLEYKRYLSKYEIYDKINSDIEHISIAVIDLSIGLIIESDGYNSNIDTEKYKKYLYNFKYDLFFGSVTNIKLEDLSEYKLNEIICKIITYSKNLNIKNKFTHNDKYRSYLEILKNDEEEIKDKNKNIMKKYFEILKKNLEIEKRNKDEKVENESNLRFDKEKEKLDKERLEKERKERLDKEKERKEKLDKERLEKERKERLEKERLEKLEKLRKERLDKEKLDKEKLDKEKQNKEKQNKDKQEEILEEVKSESVDSGSDFNSIDFKDILENIDEDINEDIDEDIDDYESLKEDGSIYEEEYDSNDEYNSDDELEFNLDDENELEDYDYEY